MPESPSSTMPRRRYDLATGQADYPDWPGPRPERTYLLCTHMRSGSTLLGEAMYWAGGMGCPLEYFHRGFQPHFEERWGTSNLEEYLRTLFRLRTEPNGSFGVKLFWRDVMELCGRFYPELGARLAPEHGALEQVDLEQDHTVALEVYQAVQRVFTELFPNPHYVFLTRRDRLRQGVSAYTAMESATWRSIPGIQDPNGEKPARCDYDRILTCASLAAYCDKQWEAFFRFANITPCRVAYEELASDYTGAVERVFRCLGVWHKDMQLEAPRMRRQADARSEALLQQFLEEHVRRQVAAVQDNSQTTDEPSPGRRPAA